MKATGDRKQCSRCGQAKGVISFTRNRSQPDGLENWCRDCRNTAERGRYHGSLDAARSAGREKQRRLRRNGDYRPVKRARRWKNVGLSRERERIYALVARAVKCGKIAKRPCETCGDPKVKAHHDDYSRPLDVMWLCEIHHRAVHARKVTP